MIDPKGIRVLRVPSGQFEVLSGSSPFGSFPAFCGRLDLDQSIATLPLLAGKRT